MASNTKATNAGPDPARAVQASKCFSSRNRHRPQDVKIASMRARDSESDTGVTIVIPSRIWRALLSHGKNAKKCHREEGETYFTRGVWHRSDNFRAVRYPRTELSNGYTRTNRNDQLSFNSFRHPRLCQYSLSYLWFRAESFFRVSIISLFSI